MQNLWAGLSLPSRRIYKFPSENRKRNLPQDKESKLIHIGHGYMNVGNFSEDDVLLKPGFHIVVSVVSVVSVVRKKFIGLIEFILSRTISCICHFFCIEHLYGRFP